VNQSTRVTPSLWHLLWGLPFLLVGIGYFCYALINGLAHMTDSLTQVVAPGNAQLNLKRGDYTVFLEEHSTVNGKIYSTSQSVSGLECRLKSSPGGVSIPLRQPGTNTSYDFSGRQGHSVLGFQITEDGSYVFACDYGQNPQGPDVVIAVGSGVGEAIADTLIKGLAAFFGACGAGGAVVLVVVLRRERNKKRLWLSGQA
jgi:hypothetical protein